MRPPQDPTTEGPTRPAGATPAQPHVFESEHNTEAASSQPQPTKRPRPTREGVRRGKWTAEEQAYADRLIRNFEAGLLPLENGATLRAYLSKKLNCDPMRISKKFAGARCLGKQIFLKRGDEAVVDQMSNEEEEVLKQLEAEFQRSISNTSSGSSSRRRNRSTKDSANSSSSNSSSAAAVAAANKRYAIHITKGSNVVSEDGETDISSDTDSELSNPQNHHHSHPHNHHHHHHHHMIAYGDPDADHRLRLSSRMVYTPDLSSASSSSDDDMKSSEDESDASDDMNFGGHGISYSRLGKDLPAHASSSSMLVIEDIREAMHSLSSESLMLDGGLPFPDASPKCVSAMRPSTSSSCLSHAVIGGYSHHSGSDDNGFFPVDFIEPLGEFLPDECFITDE